jgi:hypothetical protein
MTEPIIRIYLTPKGVSKVDAPVSTDQDRARVFEFLAGKASAAIKQLDASMRAEAEVRS